MEKAASSGSFPKGLAPPTHLHLLPGESSVSATLASWGTRPGLTVAQGSDAELFTLLIWIDLGGNRLF